MNYKNFLKKISSKDATILFNQDLKNHCSLRVGGIVKYLAIPNNLKTLKEIISKSKKYLLLGAGTNILFKSKKI